MSVSYFVRYEIESSEEFLRYFALLAQLEFQSVEAMNAALAAPERTAARRDFRAFPPIVGHVVHQAMSAEEVWRSPWLDGNEEQA